MSQERIKELTELLHQYNHEYYQNSISLVSDREFDGLLFFSPSGVTSFIEANPNVNVRTEKNTAFCIGKTTANEAEKYFNTVIVSNATTVESTIAKAVNTLKKMSI